MVCQSCRCYLCYRGYQSYQSIVLGLLLLLSSVGVHLLSCCTASCRQSQSV
jgi:hypothetical protein